VKRARWRRDGSGQTGFLAQNIRSGSTWMRLGSPRKGRRRTDSGFGRNADIGSKILARAISAVTRTSQRTWLDLSRQCGHNATAPRGHRRDREFLSARQCEPSGLAAYTKTGRSISACVFKDKTDFSLRYACDMFVVGADFCDFKTGDFEMIREYMKPIPR